MRDERDRLSWQLNHLMLWHLTGSFFAQLLSFNIQIKNFRGEEVFESSPLRGFCISFVILSELYFEPEISDSCFPVKDVFLRVKMGSNQKPFID